MEPSDNGVLLFMGLLAFLAGFACFVVGRVSFAYRWEVSGLPARLVGLAVALIGLTVAILGGILGII